MKIYNKIVLDKDNNIIEEDHFEYNGPITYCGGGGGSSSDSAGDTGHPTMTGDSNQTNWSETDDYESDFSDTPSAPEPETYSAPPASSYEGLDREQETELDQEHYQDWVKETQYPQYDGTEDLEQEREKDIDFAVEKGLITVDPNTGEQSPGPNVRNDEGIIVSKDDPSVKQNLTWKEHWDARPDIIKWSPTLSLLWATGKNLSEFLGSGNVRQSDFGIDNTQDESGDGDSVQNTSSNSQTQFIASGNTQPSNSVASNWYQSLGQNTVSGQGNAFNLATEYAAAKTRVAQRLGTPSAIGWTAVNDSPFYNFLKTNNLDRGIL